MEEIKGFVIILVSTIILMSAVELVGPDNNMKKYIKFVMGLILISVIINPIIKFCTSGQEIISTKIKDYQKEFNKNESVETFGIDKQSLQEEEFKKNFNNNCNLILSEKYPDKDFESKIDGKVDFDLMKFNVNKLNVLVKDNNIKQIEEIVIGKEHNEENDDFLIQVKKYLSDETKIDEDKIEINYQ